MPCLDSICCIWQQHQRSSPPSRFVLRALHPPRGCRVNWEMTSEVCTQVGAQVLAIAHLCFWVKHGETMGFSNFQHFFRHFLSGFRASYRDVIEISRVTQFMSVHVSSCQMSHVMKSEAELDHGWTMLDRDRPWNHPQPITEDLCGERWTRAHAQCGGGGR